jgi:hypothetical protein
MREAFGSAFIRQVLARFKTPDTITCWPEWPRNATGELLCPEVV